jgi:hypothetical protein
VAVVGETSSEVEPSAARAPARVATPAPGARPYPAPVAWLQSSMPPPGTGQGGCSSRRSWKPPQYDLTPSAMEAPSSDFAQATMEGARAAGPGVCLDLAPALPPWRSLVAPGPRRPQPPRRYPGACRPRSPAHMASQPPPAMGLQGSRLAPRGPAWRV